MRAVTIREAKARLNQLVDAAEKGEHVVLMRGSRHVAAIVPLSADDLEIAPRVSDAQAERLWRQLAEERRSGQVLVFEDADTAVRHLGAPPAAARRPGIRKRRRP
jgi:prevent-host-death family protein